MALDFEYAGPANDVTDRGDFVSRDCLQITPEVCR
jgi:hypothetical protein